MTKEDKEKAIEELKLLREEYWDDDGYGHETEQYEDTMFALDMGIKAIKQWSIPEGATNGDMIMAMFNCTVIGVSKGKVYVEHIYFPFDEDWWNAPYRESEEKKMAHDKLENYVSPDGDYIIPVTYKMYSTVGVTRVKNLREAVELSRKHRDEIPLGHGEYIDGSYKIEIKDDDDAILAQNYAHIGGVEISPEDFSSRKEVKNP
jgi:hypothetical protein